MAASTGTLGGAGGAGRGGNGGDPGQAGTPGGGGDQIDGAGGNGGNGGSNGSNSTLLPTAAKVGGNGTAGTDGAANGDFGGGGGGGGAGGYGAVASTDGGLTANLTGGNGNNGGRGGDTGNLEGDGGSGGGGGGGLEFNGDALAIGPGVTVRGGNGGAGGNGGLSVSDPDTGLPGNFAGSGGNGGNGGDGVYFDASGAVLINHGSLIGGDGGAAGAPGGGRFLHGASAGMGGAGVAGANLAINNDGLIAGGLTGNGQQDDSVAFTGGVNSIAFGAASTLTGALDVMGSATTLTFDQSTGVGFAADATLSTGVIGSGSIIKVGSGTLTIAGAETLTGATHVEGGTFLAAISHAFSSASAFTLDTGTTLDLGGINQTIASLTGTGAVTNSGTSAPAALTVSGTASTTFDGVVRDGASATGFAKGGSGTLSFTNTETYHGDTTISGGTLLVDGSIANSATTVQSGGTLGGHGTTGAVTVQSGGHFAPGDSPGVMHTGDLSLTSGASFDEQIGGTTPGTGYDQTVVTGTVALNGATLNLSQYASFVPSAGQTYTIIDNDGIDAVTGTFAGLAEGATVTLAGQTLTISYVGGTGNDVTLTSVAATNPLVVTTAADVVDPNDGLTSLREAIIYANSHAGADTITFDASVLNQTITLTSFLPVITDDLHIAGSSRNGTIISGNNATRIFFVGGETPGVQVTISDLTLENGHAKGGDSATTAGGTGGGGLGAGGAVFVRTGAAVTLDDVVLDGNTAVGGSSGVPTGVYPNGGGGGGLGGDGAGQTTQNAGNGGGGAFADGSPANGGTGGAGGGPAGGAGGAGDNPGQNGGDLSGGGGGGWDIGFPEHGGSGGFGGGGGGGNAFGDGGDGGFGGGGGGSGFPNLGGSGGFGGGGGGEGGAAGFGGGNGGNPANGSTNYNQSGGGGAGFGGAVFVMDGASLTITSTLIDGGGSVAAGSGTQTGSAAGSFLFLQHTGVTFGGGGKQDIYDTIADDYGNTDANNDGTVNDTSTGGGVTINGSTVDLHAVNTYHGATTVQAGTLQVDGSIANSAVTVKSGATIDGFGGTTGTLTVEAGGHLAPGPSNDPGALHTGNLSLASISDFTVAIDNGSFAFDPQSHHGYSYVGVTGTVALGGATLTMLSLDDFAPTPGESYKIIDNDGSDAVTGTFAGLAEGATFSFEGETLKISYVGGTGNDVVLSDLGQQAQPPSVAINTIAGDNVVNAAEGAATITVSGTSTNVEDGQTVTLTLKTGDGATTLDTMTTTVSGGAWHIDIPPGTTPAFPDAQYLVTADVSDQAGDPATEATQTITVDTTPPTITINTVAGDDVVNAAEGAATITVSGTAAGAEDGRTVTLALKTADGSTTLQTMTTTVSSGAWHIDLPPGATPAFPDGDYLVTADISDQAGNPATEATRTITVDTTPPTVTFNTIAGNDVVNAAEGAATITVSGTAVGAEDGQVITLALKTANGATTLQTLTMTVSGGAWHIDLPPGATPAFPDGPYLVTADVSDAAGNPATEATHLITVDTHAPTITINTIAGDDVVSAAEGAGVITVSGLATGAEDGQVVTLALKTADGSTTLDTMTTTVSGGAWHIDLPPGATPAFPDGDYLVTADVSDAAGNPATEATHLVVVDTHAPTVTIDPIAGDDVVSAAEGAGTITVSGTAVGAEGGQVVTLALKTANGATTLQTLTTTVSGGAWHIDLPPGATPAFPDGQYLVTADVSDQAGNPATEAARTITVDTMPPTVTIDPIAGDDVVSAAEGAGTITVSGLATGAEDGRVVTLALKTADGSTTLDTMTTTVSGGAWHIDLPPGATPAFPDGQYLVTADVSDAAGNPATEATHTITVNTTVSAPSVNIAPVNTVPGTQNIEANMHTAIDGLSIADVDAAAGSLTTTLSVLHGTLSVAPLGGAGVSGSGTGTVTIAGTVSQINAALGSHNVVYAGDHDHFGADTLTITTNDNGNTGTGGALSDTDQVAINVDGAPHPYNWQASGDLGAHPLGYQVAGIGDFNGDGTADVLWRNPTTGQLDEWRMQNDNWAASMTPGTHTAAETVVGVGDFNGDGTSDVLWRDPATGHLDVSIMANGQITNTVDLGSHGADWKVLGVGDFDGDHTSDILFQNVTTGAVDEWVMAAGNWSKSISLGVHSTAFSSAAIGDFDGDGTSDVLWFNPSSGAVDEWYMKAGNWSNSVGLGSHDPSYQLAAVGDFNGDGTSDVLWRNPTTGAVDGWVMHDTQWFLSVSLGAFDPHYNLAGTGNFDHAGGADVLWNNPTTDQTSTWLLHAI